MLYMQRSAFPLMKIHPTDHNLDLASAMLAEMEDYLLSAEVFWPLDQRAARGEPPFPRLTLGAMQLTLDQLEAMHSEMTGAQSAGHRKVMAQVDLLRRKHAVALERKAAREAVTRLNLWRAFVNELEESPARAGNYAYEVRHRVMLARLAEKASQSAELEATLDHVRAIDRRLRRLFVQDAFIWDQRLQKTYPPERYWYLYGHPRME